MPVVYTQLPTAQQFKKDSNILLANRNQDKVLIELDRLLAVYPTLSGATPYQTRIKQQMTLAKLWFTCDYWLKIVDGGKRYAESANMNASRRPVVYELYKAIVDTLVNRTTIPVNKLPEWLELTFGRGMDVHGVETDSGGRAKYLTPEDLKRYRLHFRSGLAYQEQWWDNSGELIRAESTHSLMAEKADEAAHREGLSGYAVSLGRDFYLAPHFVSGKESFFHSSYLGGQAVLCAGTMKIVNGEVLLITNSSGHYRPTDSHLALAVEALYSVGVPLDRLRVRGFTNAECSGEEFLLRVTFDLNDLQAKELNRELARLALYKKAGDLGRKTMAEKSRIIRELVLHIKTEHGGKKNFKCLHCKRYQGQEVMEAALWMLVNKVA